MLKKIREVIQYSDLIERLTVRDLKVRYKGSVMGFLWTFINPLLMMVILTVVFKLVVRIEVDKYPLFVLAGLLPWNFLTVSLGQCTGSIVGNASLVKKVYLPKEVFPLSMILSNLVNFLVSLVIFAALMVLFKVQVGFSLLFLPVVLLVQIMFITGLCLLFSCLNVFFRDLEHITGILVMLWFYVTPVFYPVSMVPKRFLALYMLNPMAALIDAYRGILVYNSLPQWPWFGLAAAVSLAFFLAGYLVFIKYEDLFGEVI